MEVSRHVRQGYQNLFFGPSHDPINWRFIILAARPNSRKETRMRLKGDEAALVAAAVRGATLNEIAGEAGVSTSTVQRRLHSPEIDAAIREGRAHKQREAVGGLNSDLNVAIERLGALVMDEDPRIALSAIDKLIAHAHRFNRAADERPRPEDEADSE